MAVSDRTLSEFLQHSGGFLGQLNEGGLVLPRRRRGRRRAHDGEPPGRAGQVVQDTSRGAPAMTLEPPSYYCPGFVCCPRKISKTAEKNSSPLPPWLWGEDELEG